MARGLFIPMVLVMALAWGGLAGGESKVDSKKARQLLKAGGVLLDVRTPREYAEERIAGSTNVPLDELKLQMPQPEFMGSNGTPVLVHCRSGGRAGTAVELLRKHGYTNVYSLGSFSEARKLTGRQVAR